MKKYLFIFLLFLISFPSYATEAIYFLDVDQLVNSSNAGKKIISKLKKINDQNLIEIEKYEKKLKKEDNEINNVKNVISNDDLKIRVENLKEKILLYRDKKDKMFKEYNNLKNRELEIFFKKITPYIEEYMETNSIKLIIDKKNVFIANKNYDITRSLINYLNLKLKDD